MVQDRGKKFLEDEYSTEIETPGSLLEFRFFSHDSFLVFPTFR